MVDTQKFYNMGEEIFYMVRRKGETDDDGVRLQGNRTPGGC